MGVQPLKALCRYYCSLTANKAVNVADRVRTMMKGISGKDRLKKKQKQAIFEEAKNNERYSGVA